MYVSKNFLLVFKTLILMTIGLMALGAGVRAMNAGLACPDWPLCFGQVIPDFHVGVWFEFVHRSYAGLVALIFFGCLLALLRNKSVPRVVKRIGLLAFVVLVSQIVMGGLTVLKLLKVGIVTSHLMLATFFVSLLLWMACWLNPDSVHLPKVRAPAWFRYGMTLFPFFVLGQIFLGGLVASSYAGVVCVDFPKCNGEWIPTLQGAIGLQVLHRLGAYTIAVLALASFIAVHFSRTRPWMTRQVQRWVRIVVSITFLQVCVGIANLILFIPASMTVLHQSMAMLTLLASWRLAFVARRVSAPELQSAKDESYQVDAGVSGCTSGAAF